MTYFNWEGLKTYLEYNANTEGLQLKLEGPSRPKVMWTTSSALNFAREFERRLSPGGWHVALAGSVLLHGQSYKDLDLVVFPHSYSEQNHAARVQTMEDMGLVRTKTPDQMRQIWAASGSSDTKDVEVWHTEDKRVDILLLK